MKVLLNSFHLNGSTLEFQEFDRDTLSSESRCAAARLSAAETGLQNPAEIKPTSRAPERGTLFTFRVYGRIGISRVEVYERVGKSVI